MLMRIKKTLGSFYKVSRLKALKMKCLKTKILIWTTLKCKRLSTKSLQRLMLTQKNFRLLNPASTE